MARTVWGAHKRYMDTYLNVYKGYYVSVAITFAGSGANVNSLPGTALGATTKVTTGSEAASTMSSTSVATVCLLPKLKQRSSSTVSPSSVARGND